MADLECQTIRVTELINSLPEILFPPYNPQKTYIHEGDGNEISTSPSDAAESETGVIESVRKDDKPSLIAHSKWLEQNLEPMDGHITSKLLQLCCAFDSVVCAAALIAGEVGETAAVNQSDETGRTPLHAAAEYQSARCVELLLRKRARTDVRTKDGRRLLPLELSLTSPSLDMDGVWNPEDYSIEDLVVLLGEKDLTTIRLISEKSKEVAQIACAKAVKGRIMALGALLVVAAEKINESTVQFYDADPTSKETTTVYESVVRKALSLGRETTNTHSSSSTSLGASNDMPSEKKRALLLAEIELLQLFGVVSRCPEKNATPLLVRAVLAGDDVIAALLLKTDIDINEADSNGNSALHCFLKTSKSFSQHEIKILALLIEHGARMGQKNKLGLTALHMAAGNGHLSALQILLIEDSEGINYKTEMKETPLFFAVKNDHLDCAEFLLRWGANSEVLNIRQRPIDLAVSQDMRYMLNPTNICLMNRAFAGQEKYINRLLNMDDNCESLPTDEDTSSRRSCLSTTMGICKYFSARQGCVGGAKCFCAHDEEEHQTFHHGTLHHRQCNSAMDPKKRIFVGGLPLTLDSASLRKYFEENFGPVENAKILMSQIGDLIQSRGFGFVTFRDEKDVEAAIYAHYVFIMDKQVEIKSVVPKGINEHKLWTQPESEGESKRHQTQEQSSSEAQRQTQVSFEGPQTPTWLRIFKKWLPCFLKDMSKHRREGHYALSSLKADFRSKFGLELDHSSLGYSKLSDFMRLFSDICCTRVLPLGRSSGGGSPNHMVLLPKSFRTQQLLRQLSTIESIIGGGVNYLSESAFPLEEDLTPGSQDFSPAERVNPPAEFDIVSLSDAQPMFMQLLEQDPLFHIRPWLQNQHNTDNNDTKEEIERFIKANQNNSSLQQRHLVLEALAKNRKCPSFYFLREFDFYSNYNEGVKEGKCFACDERKALWANFPCKHLLWCVDCKTQASLAGGSSVHKCVVCDTHVQKIDLLTCHDYRQLVGQYLFNEDFPPLDPNHLRSSSGKKILLPVGT